ncbi:syndecan-4 isoform X2 [Hypomesus transpacificus]|uniref:syndecan-4 isoform X2 n=1 Tax=Hypomesus transpacificus TaxID=137520 RepID=UPI001F071CD5|nr:syndecan-4 isoform X2 [Hypomesus transpacificus]
MYKVCLVLVLFASVYSESARETETWMPMKTTQPAQGMLEDIAGSGASTTAGHSDDFGFTDDDEDDEDDYDTYGEDEDYEDEEMSGSGDGVPTVTINNDNTHPSSNPNINENKIPELEVPFRPRPTVNEIDLVQNRNEVPVRAEPPQQEEHPSNVLMSHAGSEGLFNKTEILAAVIVGGAVTLLCAVLLIVFLIYRMRKKDEGSYDLGKKPIYKKAPTTEIYA